MLIESPVEKCWLLCEIKHDFVMKRSMILFHLLKNLN
jgi:hypothetical protein